MTDVNIARRSGGDPLIERTGFRLSWGAVIAGMFVATALHIVLALIGAALGFGMWDRGDDVGTLGAGVGIWTVVSGIIALFVGGLVTGRLAGILTRGDGALHGVLLWSLSTIVAAWMVVSGIGSIVGGAFNILSRTAAAAVGGATTGVAQAGGALLGQAGDIDWNALQREVERTLEQTQSPGLQPDTLRADARRAQAAATGARSNEEVSRDVVQTIRERAGEVDRQAVVNVLAARTGMTRAEAERAAERVENLAASARAQLRQTADTLGVRAERAAEDASDAIAQAALWTLLTLALSLGASVGGTVIKARE